MKTALTAAFLAGFGVMALEILGARWLAPAFGFTLSTWAFLIAATLLAGALGAAVGGFLARTDGTRRAGIAFLAGAVFVAANAFFAPGLVDSLLRLPLAQGVAVASAAVLLVPVAALAAVMPLVATRVGRSGIGRAVGALVAASTVGSLAGTLATALWFVPGLGLRATAISLSILFAGFGAFALLSDRSRVAGAASAFLLAVPLFFPPAPEEEMIVRETPYGRLAARHGEVGFAVRIDGVLQGSGPLHPYPGELLSRGQYFELLPWLHPAGRTALNVGLGTGLVPRCLNLYGIETTSLEVNPVLVEVVREATGFEGEVRVGDGRALLRRMAGTFDFVILDVFQGEGLPSHLLSREAFAEVEERLAPGGVLLVHLIGRPDHPVTGTVAATLAEVFPRLLAIRNGVGDEMQDVFLFASDRVLEAPPAPELAELGWLGNETFDPPAAEVACDDRNFLDRLNEPLARELRRLSLGGGE